MGFGAGQDSRSPAFCAATPSGRAASTRCRKRPVEKRLLLAAVLSLAVLFLWEWIAPRPARQRVPSAPRVTSAPTASRTTVASAVEPAALPPPVGDTTESSTTVENGVVRATFSNRGAVLTSFLLRNYSDEQRHPLELVRLLAPPARKPLALDFTGKPDLSARAAQALFVIERGSGQVLRFRYADATVAVTKEIRLGAGYLHDVKVSVVGPAYTLLAGTGLRNPTEGEQASRYVMPASAIVSSGGGLARAAPDKLDKPAVWPVDDRGFAGLEDNYFLAVLLPRQAVTAQAFSVPVKDAAGKSATVAAAGLSASGELSLQAYFGPKDVEVLESLNLGLERTVDFGWFGILARPLLWLLKRTYAWVGNYGVAILLVTLLLRVLLFPLMHKSYASMKKMQKLAPKMNAIRDKYKKARTDAAQRQKMNQELTALYQAEGYNPMSGCFPILLQLPILVAFYNVLSRAIELRHAPFALWITDLSAVDRTYVLLILMTVTMYVQQAMTPSTADPMQKRIFMAMPLVWGFFLKDMPSGLVLYWLFSNVLTILQQVIINRLSAKDEPSPEKPKRLKQARA